MTDIILTSEPESVRDFSHILFRPASDSHKGQNGKLLIIGGSHLFHAAVLWAAETAAYFVDMVHFSSTIENMEVFTSLKKKFRNGIIVPRSDLESYIREDDAILIGPGMVRDGMHTMDDVAYQKMEEIVSLTDEAAYSYALPRYLITTYPGKRYVIDAGALQMIEPSWLKNCIETPIVTPHQLEFERVFGISLQNKSNDEKCEIVKSKAAEFGCVILLKAVVDIISDGKRVIQVEGGNAGLTKGGSGDTLAGVVSALRTKNGPIESAVIASYVVKRAADDLFTTKGYWYNMYDLIEKIPEILKIITL